MRKHFKNWSILATIIGGTVISASNVKADAGLLMQGMEIASHTYTAARPVLKMASEAGIASDAFSKKGVSPTDLAGLDPTSIGGKLVQAKLRYDAFQQGGPPHKSTSILGEAELDVNGNPKASVPLALGSEAWRETMAYKAARGTLNAILLPVHIVKYGLDKIYEARQASHRWLEELDTPNIFAKTGVLTFDVLALPFTGAKYAIDWAVKGAYACLDYLCNPEISPVTKVLKVVQLGLFVLAAKTAATAIMAAVAG